MIGEPLWEGAEAAEPEESRASRANSSPGSAGVPPACRQDGGAPAKAA
jgi:hypothetical protein